MCFIVFCHHNSFSSRILSYNSTEGFSFRHDGVSVSFNSLGTQVYSMWGRLDWACVRGCGFDSFAFKRLLRLMGKKISCVEKITRDIIPELILLLPSFEELNLSVHASTDPPGIIHKEAVFVVL